MSDLDPLQEGEWSTGSDELVNKRKMTPLVILIGVALLAVIAMSFNVFAKSVVYYKTPTEVKASPAEVVRLSGKVVPGSIQTDPTSGVVTFQVTDGTTTLDVDYDGAAPDTLKDNAEAVAEGQYANGVFEAKTLFAKCPSKFGTQTPTEGV